MKLLHNNNLVYFLNGLTNAGASVIGSGIDLLGSAISGAINASQAKKQREWQEYMYNKQMQDTVKLRNESWQRQDALLADERQYNSPVNQIALAKDAGLNPALLQGGQITNPLTGVSSAGTSPEAPSPGNYAFTPVDFGSFGTRAAGNLIQAQGMDIAQQNADTAKVNAETQKFAAKARSIRDLAEAGKLNEETAAIYLRNLFDSETLETRINIINEQFESITYDNLTKDFDLRFMRPQLYEKLKAEAALVEGELKLIPQRLKLLGAETRAADARHYESLAHADLMDAERITEYQRTSYTNMMYEIAKEKLTQEEFNTAMQETQFWFTNINDSVDSASHLIDSVSGLIPGSGIVRKAGNAIFKKKKQNIDSKVPDDYKGPIKDTSKWKTPRGKAIWSGLSEYQKKMYREDPVFKQEILPYLESNN